MLTLCTRTIPVENSFATDRLQHRYSQVESISQYNLQYTTADTWWASMHLITSGSVARSTRRVTHANRVNTYRDIDSHSSRKRIHNRSWWVTRHIDICLAIVGADNLKSSLRRLAKDHALLRSSLPPNYLFASDDDSLPDDLTQLLIYLTGSEGTPYSQGLWQLHLRMPTDYPKSPPKATFRTRIFHPNVEENTGAVCLETLKRDWDPKLTLKDILVTISCLLIQPNPDSALNEKAGVLVREDYPGFERQAKLMTRIHAPIPEKLREAVDEARQRGEDKPSASTTETCTTNPQADVEANEGSDSAKENAPRPVTSKSDATKKRVLGKRPLSDLPVPVDSDENSNSFNSTCASTSEPLKKSPKHTHTSSEQQSSVPQQLQAEPNEVRMSKEQTTLSQPKHRAVSITSSSVRPQLRSISSGSSGKLRTQARIGIKRLWRICSLTFVDFLTLWALLCQWYSIAWNGKHSILWQGFGGSRQALELCLDWDQACIISELVRNILWWAGWWMTRDEVEGKSQKPGVWLKPCASVMAVNQCKRVQSLSILSSEKESLMVDFCFHHQAFYHSMNFLDLLMIGKESFFLNDLLSVIRTSFWATVASLCPRVMYPPIKNQQWKSWSKPTRPSCSSPEPKNVYWSWCWFHEHSCRHLGYQTAKKPLPILHLESHIQK